MGLDYGDNAVPPYLVGQSHHSFYSVALEESRTQAEERFVRLELLFLKMECFRNSSRSSVSIFKWTMQRQHLWRIWIDSMPRFITSYAHCPERHQFYQQTSRRLRRFYQDIYWHIVERPSLGWTHNACFVDWRVVAISTTPSRIDHERQSHVPHCPPPKRSMSPPSFCMKGRPVSTN